MSSFELHPRLDLLREALPYIQRFKGKTFIVKVSGKVTEERGVLKSLADEIALLHNVGVRVCVVHGGGKQLNELASALGIEQRIINGRRVTDGQTLEMAKMIFAGKINTEILAALRVCGVATVGLSGVDGEILHAEKRPVREITNHATGAREAVDFGFVGDVTKVDGRLLEVLLQHDYVPVVSSLAADAEGTIFNINADTVAVEIAVELAAEKLILLSDVDGLRLDAQNESSKVSRLSLKQAMALIESGAATGGMLPKLQAIIDLIQRGVESAHIINGTRRNALLAEVFTDKGTGTMISKL